MRNKMHRITTSACWLRIRNVINSLLQGDRTLSLVVAMESALNDQRYEVSYRSRYHLPPAQVLPKKAPLMISFKLINSVACGAGGCIPAQLLHADHQ